MLDSENVLAGLVHDCTDPVHYRQQAQKLATVPALTPSAELWRAQQTHVPNPLLSASREHQGERVARLRQVWEDMKQAPSPDSAGALGSSMARGLRPEAQFRAGDLHCAPQVWAEYAALAQLTEEAALELDIIEHGLRLDWCHPTEARKQTEPNHRKKVEGVRAQLLRAGYGAGYVEAVLLADEPVTAALPNLLNDPVDYKFAREQVHKNVKCGALIKWPFQGTRPFFVLTLAVVRNSVGKQRLIVDGRLLNLRLQRLCFKYETAADAVRLLRDQHWAWTLDVKAGYHHVMLRPEEWTYVGVEFEGTFYVHAALPFGLSISPERFTRLMRLTMKPLLAHGLRLTGMVDDSLGAAPELHVAQRDLGLQVEIMGLLGWTLNAAKSAREPAKVVQYLGLEYNLTSRNTTLPAEKLARFAENLRRLRSDVDGTVKRYRSMVGQLASAALALPLSPLLVRTLTLEKAAADAGTEVGARALHKQLADFFLTDISGLVGRPWDAAIRPAQTLVVDTSETASGAFLVGSAWKAYLPLTALEQALRQEDILSSTEAELLGILRALNECVRTLAVPADGTGAVQVLCDNQGAVSALTHMRGGPRVFPVVAQVYRLAAQYQLVLTFAWRRRSTAEIVLADKYSKLDDETDWRLSRSVLWHQVKRHAQSWADAGFFPPDIDMMASHQAHQVSSYVSRFWDGSCIAQDAMVQHWSKWPAGSAPRRAGRPPCLFLFPPAADLPQVLMKIDSERPTVWLVCTRYMREIDERYMAQWPVKARFPLQCREVAHVVKATALNPAKKRQEQWRTPLQVLFVTWEE